jgi:hypothetical protein
MRTKNATSRERAREAERRYAATEHGRTQLAAKQRRRREAHAAYMLAWRNRNYEKVREYERRHLLSNTYLVRRCAKYGITAERYMELVAQQEGRCAICREPPSARAPLCIDHNHASGVVRGLLCKVCDLAVGNLRDSVARARATLAYLERFE